MIFRFGTHALREVKETGERWMHASMEDFANEWIASWNAHDIDRIAGHYAEDVVFYSPFVWKRLGLADGRIDGKAALRSYFSDALLANPGLRFDLDSLYEGMNSVGIRYMRPGGPVGFEMMVFDELGRVREARCHYFPGIQ